ncbi:hypothetical protein PI125_g21527, partial [Phytophthora idaei]
MLCRFITRFDEQLQLGSTKHPFESENISLLPTNLHLHQIVWRCGTSLRSMRVSRMELSQQFLNMQRIVNCALLTKLAARWRKS